MSYNYIQAYSAEGDLEQLQIMRNIVDKVHLKH